MECVYDEPMAMGRRMLPRSAAAAHTGRVEPCRRPSTSLAFEASHVDDEVSPNGDLAFTDDLGVNNAQLQFFGGNKRQSADFTFDELFAFEDDILGQPQCLPDASLPFPHHPPGQQSGSWCSWMRGNLSLAVVTENSSVTSNSNVLALLQSGPTHAQHNADLIIQSLRSIPTMMLRRETFPWFIHPHSQLLSESTGAALPEALSNCMSIAQMFASRTPETRYFFRQTIGTEYRRFISEARFLLTPLSSNTDRQKDVPYVQIRTPCRNASLHDLFHYVYR